MYDSTAACVKEDRPATFMEMTIKRTIQTSDSINNANSKLNALLVKLRGERPPQTNPELRKEPAKFHCDLIDSQLSAQAESLNYLHNQIDELATII
ncbi:MAG: hypothetical protein HQK96_03755 [Nitrospirae bacterium]|nr:hypothetical protein [Nitrospirota bacterium]